MTTLLHRAASLFRNVSRPRQVERDLDDEIASTFALMVDDKTAAGLERGKAERAVRLELTPEQVKEQVRSSRSGARFESIVKDARYAVRSLVRTPGFTAVTLLTLALGIGANTAMFSTLGAVSMRALPFRDADELVLVWEDASWAGFPQNTPAPANFLDWKRMSRSFADLAASRSATGNFTGDGAPEQLRGRGVTANFFSLLGVQPLAGRTFTSSDDQSGEPLMVISDRLWARRYGRDPSVIGRAVFVSGSRTTVLGVMPPSFVFRDREIDFWRLTRFTPQDAANRGAHFLTVVGRRASGVSLEQSRAEMQGIGAQLMAAYPESNRGGTVVVPLADDILGNARTGVVILAAAAACVLLIACANLASLLLSRAVRRRGEFAMRVALGASGGRLVQQTLVESMLLACAGGALGLVLAPVGMRLLAGLMPRGLPAIPATALDLRLLLFASVVSLATGVLCGVTPAALAARGAIQSHLHEGGRSGIRGHNRARDVLVVAQIAVALVLLVAAGLMLRTLWNLRSLDLGFPSESLIAVRTTLPAQRYQEPQRRLAFYARVLDETKALPGVRAAAYVSTVPFAERGNSNSYLIEGQALAEANSQDALLRVGTGSYLTTLGARVVEGRLLGEQDGADAPGAIVVNQTFARHHWPSESALGRRVSLNGNDGPWRTIVGVVADIRERGYLLEAKPAVYLPFAQALDTWATPEYLVLRTTEDTSTLSAPVRQIVTRADPEQPVAAMRTMQDVIDGDVSDRRQQLTLLAAFAGLAVLLATVGLYGLLSYSVAQRRREFGVRMTLGAGVGTVTALALGHGVALVGAGLAIGSALAAIATQALTALLYGIRPTDPATFGGVIAMIATISLAACALPALRAARLDPASVLRDE